MMSESNPFELLEPDQQEAEVHVFGSSGKILCKTEAPGKPKNRDLNMNELVVGLGNDIPLWKAGAILYWRFEPRSFRAFARPDAAKQRIRQLIQRALDLWGDACPVRFEERKGACDFDVVLRNSDDCNATGCVLASAFFPDNGRHRLIIYPRMLQQDEQEQIETLVHELGHVFGLRHFFAKVSETQLPAEIFGTHVDFSIMNYGSKSVLTDADRADLKTLYESARSGALLAINGTRIRLVQPFSALGA